MNWHSAICAHHCRRRVLESVCGQHDWGNEKLAFILGSVCGTAGGLLSFLAVLKGSFLLFAPAAFLSASIKLSASTIVWLPPITPAGSEGQSISLVMIGGVVAAILGPLLTIIARDVPGYLALPVFISLWQCWVFCLRLIWPCSSIEKKRSPCPGQRRASARVTDQSAVNETCGLPYGLASPGRGLLRDAFLMTAALSP
jgi:hypothetical protein